MSDLVDEIAAARNHVARRRRIAELPGAGIDDLYHIENARNRLLT